MAIHDKRECCYALLPVLCMLLVMASAQQGPLTGLDTQDPPASTLDAQSHHPHQANQHYINIGDPQQRQGGPAPLLQTRALAPAILCPATTVTLSPGTDLSSSTTAGNTYILTAGTYSISFLISLSSGTTCFKGPPGASRDDVVITISTGDSSNNGRGFRVSGDFAALRLEQLVLDGQGTAPGVFATGSTLELQDVEVRNCRLTEIFDPTYGGAAIRLKSGIAHMNATTFVNNTSTTYGGAAGVYDGCVALLNQVAASNNTADESGGAFHVYNTGVGTGVTTVMTLSNSTLSGNSAGVDGGGLSVFDGVAVNLVGTVCAISNTAGLSSGGFAVVYGGEVRVADDAEVNMDGNTPSAVALQGGQFFCGTSSSTSWRDNKAYNIIGPACAPQCDAAFTNTTDTSVTTCDTCTFGWNTATCGCNKDCTPGPPCCTDAGDFVTDGRVCGPDGTSGQCDASGNCGCTPGLVCRVANGPCDAAEVCRDDRTCPDDGVKVAGTWCREANSTCEVDTVCNGKTKTCPVTVAYNGKKCTFTPPSNVTGAARRGVRTAAQAADYDQYKAPGLDWPPCKALSSCLAGKCVIDESKPGCCYLNDEEESYGYEQAYAKTAGGRQTGEVYCWEAAV